MCITATNTKIQMTDKKAATKLGLRKLQVLSANLSKTIDPDSFAPPPTSDLGTSA